MDIVCLPLRRKMSLASSVGKFRRDNFRLAAPTAATPRRVGLAKTGDGEELTGTEDEQIIDPVRRNCFLYVA